MGRSRVSSDWVSESMSYTSQGALGKRLKPPVPSLESGTSLKNLESASHKIQQVGNFIQQEQWTAVRLRAEEILTSCKLTLTRWPDQLSEERRNEVLTASSLMRSITLATADSADGVILQKKKISDAHIRASGHISSALGAARREEERDGEGNDGN